MSAYDPQGVKGTGITYATSPMGADHTAGLTYFLPMDHHDKEGQVEASRDAQVERAAYDSLGLCLFLMAATGHHPDKVVNMVNSLYDLDKGEDYLENLGKRTIAEEKEFSENAGLRDSDDRIPEYFKNESLPPYDLKWDFESEELDRIFDEL